MQQKIQKKSSRKSCKNLAENLAKNLAENLAKHLAENLAKILRETHILNHESVYWNGKARQVKKYTHTIHEKLETVDATKTNQRTCREETTYVFCMFFETPQEKPR